MELPPNRAFATGTVALRPSALPDLAGLTGDERAQGRDPVIVIGGGPSGLRVAQEVTRRGRAVVLFNAERWRPYNRVQLTPFFAGEVQLGRIFQSDLFAADARITQYTGHTIVRIDRDARFVENQFGRRWSYAKLVLCLGSRPHIPPIPGRDVPGVFRFRNIDDVELLMARAARSRRTIVVGGGLLGLEAARAMSRRRVPTVVVEHEQRLMARQLDDDGAALLKAEIAALGLDVRTGCSLKQIGGTVRVERVVLSDGTVVECDSVIICTGIRANIELARAAGIAVGRGINVNDAMQTSDPDVYAVGECAEHDGHCYGLVAPGLEQAAVAAAHLCEERVVYGGSVPTTKLKIVGIDVFSMGDVEQLEQRDDIGGRCWTNRRDGQYRRLVTRRGRLVGALGVGSWPEVSRVQQAVRDRTRIWPWRAWRFARTGRLFGAHGSRSVREWPPAATVCNCTGVTRGRLAEAIATGAVSVEVLMRETSASTVCGTCRPLLQDLLGPPVVHAPAFGWRAIVAASFVAAVVAASAMFLPAWPYSSSVEDGIGIDRLWIDGTWKQVTGFTLVGLLALTAFLSVRKRINQKRIGSYPAWRVFHALVGAAALAALFLHTGFNLGVNLNQWLMLTLLALVVLGALTGLVTAREDVLLSSGRTSLRAALTWLHILAFWPLPLLLFIHVVAAYAY
jgi:nitrite reductase (NADH) large subunit